MGESGKYIDTGIAHDPSQRADTTPNYDLAEYRNQLLAAVAPGEPSRRDRVDRNTRDELVAEYKVMAGIIDKAVDVVEGFYKNNPSGGPTGTITYQEVEREGLVPEQMDKLTLYQRKLVEQQARLVVDQCAAILRIKTTMTDAKQWVSDVLEISLSGDVQVTYPTPSTMNIIFDNKQDFEKIGSKGQAAYFPYDDPRIAKNAPELRGCIVATDGTAPGVVSILEPHEWRHRVNATVFPEHIDNWTTQDAIDRIHIKIGDPSIQVPDDVRVVEWWLNIVMKDMRDKVLPGVWVIALDFMLTHAKEEIIAYAYSNHFTVDDVYQLLTKEGGPYDYFDRAGLRALAQSQPNVDIHKAMQDLIDDIWHTHVREVKIMMDTVKQMGIVDATGHLQLDPKTFNLLAITPHKHWKYLLAPPRTRVATSPAPAPIPAPVPAPTPPVEPTPTPERRPQPLGKKKVYFIDVSEIAKAMAWREAEEKERELLDTSGVFRRWYIRTSGRKFAFYKEALHAIQSNKNLLAQIEARARGESGVHIDAGSQGHSYEILDAVIKQFVEEINLQNEKGEAIQSNADVNRISADLFYRHAIHPMTRQQFDEEVEHQLLPLLSGKKFSDDASREREQKGILFASNFWELAQEYSSHIQAIAEQYPGDEDKALTHVRREMALDIQLGLKQRDLYDNKPKEILTRFEKYTDAVEKLPVLGKFLSNPVTYGILGGFVGNMLFRRGAKAAVTAGLMATILGAAPAFAPLLASMAVGGAFVALRRMKELKYDRGLALRQSALGAQTAQNDRQRKALEQFHYDHIKAEIVIPRLDAMVAQNNLTDDDRNYIADIMARIQVEQEKSVDLIGVEYGLPYKTKEVAMTDLKIRLRDVRRKFGCEDDANLPPEIATHFNQRKNELVQNIEENDKAFDKYKRGQGWRAGLAGAAVGGLAGTVGQFAWFKGLEAVGHAPKTDSYIEAFWHHMAGTGGKGAGVAQEVAQGAGGSSSEGVAEHVAEVARPGFHDVHVDLPGAEDVNVKVPDGMNIIPDSNGDVFDLVNEKGKVIFENLHFNTDGSLTEDTISQLKEQGFNLEDVITKESKVVDPMEYVKDMLDKNARADWHDEPGKRFSSFFNKLIEFEGKQQMGYVHKSADGNVYFDIRGIADNLMKNAEDAFDTFGRNPDGSFDSKLEHLRDQIRQWNSEGSLLKHLQLAIFPTDELNKKGLSILVNGASADGRLTLPPEIAKLFTTEQSLHYLHHPVKFMEIRLDGHALATTIGKDMTKQLIEATVHNPLIMPPAPGGPVEAPWALPFWKRNPLKKAPLREAPPPLGDRGEPYGGYYRYGEIDPRRAEEYRARFSERIRNNPKARLDASVEIPDYFKRQSPEHIQSLEKYIMQDGMKEPMHEECEAVVCIPVYTLGEGQIIRHTLEKYLQQIDAGKNKQALSPDKIEIILFLNHPNPKREEIEQKLGHAYTEGAEARVKSGKPELYDTEEVIRQFQLEHPELPVRIMKEEFPERPVWGKIIKPLYDIALLRGQRRAKNNGKDVLILTNDADVVDMSPTYLRDIMQPIDLNTILSDRDATVEQVDGIVGRIDFPYEVYEKSPAFLAAARTFEFFDAQLRKDPKRGVVTQGRSTALRASTYAAIGGVFESTDAGADTELGRMVGLARNDKKTIRYDNGAWLTTDPRREYQMWEKNIPLPYAWNEWAAMNVYGKDWKQRFTSTTPRGTQIDRQLFQDEFNEEVRRWGLDPTDKRVGRILKWLGCTAGDYEVGTVRNKKGEQSYGISIKSIANLDKALQEDTSGERSRERRQRDKVKQSTLQGDGRFFIPGDQSKDKGVFISYFGGAYHEMNRLYSDIFFSKEYPWHPDASNPHPVVIDLGSHVGVSVAYWKKVAPSAKVTAVEANPAAHTLLEKNVKQNEFTDVDIVHGAVSDSAGGKVPFYVPKPGTEFAWGATTATPADLSKYDKVDVSTVTLSKLIKGPVDLLKIDIEGTEYSILKEAESKLNLVKEIMMEFHHDPGRPQNSLQDMLAILKRQGFTAEVRQWNQPVDVNTVDLSQSTFFTILAQK